MRIFVTGASGWIGSALVADLLAAGHRVVGLARSDASAEKVEASGAAVRPGDLTDLDGLRAAAADSEGVAHLGFVHDFSSPEAFARSTDTDLAAIRAMSDALVGTDRPFVIASGLVGIAPGRVATEADAGDPSSMRRLRSEQAVVALAERGVRSASVRLAPTVHGAGDEGFVASFVATARELGTSAYVGDGANRWPAVHRDDAARLFRLALEQAPPGSRLHAAAEEAVPFRDIAGAIGAGLDLPVVSVEPDRATEHFGFLGTFAGADAPASSQQTRDLLGWQPTGPGLLADIAAHYT